MNLRYETYKCPSVQVVHVEFNYILNLSYSYDVCNNHKEHTRISYTYVYLNELKISNHNSIVAYCLFFFLNF